jgi:hypothetical protein
VLAIITKTIRGQDALSVTETATEAELANSPAPVGPRQRPSCVPCSHPLIDSTGGDDIREAVAAMAGKIQQGSVGSIDGAMAPPAPPVPLLILMWTATDGRRLRAAQVLWPGAVAGERSRRGGKSTWMEEEGRSFLFYSSDMWTLDVMDMVKNLESCQTLFDIPDPRWSGTDLQLRSYFLELQLCQA